jgi:ribosomal protein S1
MSTKTKQYLERSIKYKHIVTGTVIGKETIENEIYANVMYDDEKILIKQEDLNERDVRDKVGLLLGAQVDILVTGYDQKLKAFTGSRKEANKILKDLFQSKINIGDEISAKTVVVAKNNIIVDVYGTEVTIKSKYLKLGWVEDAREVIKLGDEIKVSIINIEPLEVEVIKDEEEFDPERYKIEDEYLAKVIATPAFGIICEISGERQVLCYKPEWREELQIGQYVVLQINGINPDEKRTYGFIKRRIRK